MIVDAAGRFVGRCDSYWDEFGVAGECDGDVKYDPAGLERDAERRRHSLLEQTGLTVVRWRWSDLAAFEPTLQRLRDALARGERPGSPRRRWAAHPTGLHLPAYLSDASAAE